MSKAFDSLHPEGIINSLVGAGFANDTVDLIRNYLSDRRQITKINGCQSTLTEVFYGVPQGSVLGPLLFTLYVNELSSVARIAKVSQYADDVTIYCAAKNPALAQTALQYDINRICHWMAANSLQVNGKKSQLMVIKAKAYSTDAKDQVKSRSLADATEPEITLLVGEQLLKPQPKVEILGFVLDEHLLLNEQVNAVRKKTRSGLFALKQASKHGLNIGCLVQMANGLIASYLHYCDTVLGLANSTALKGLQARQDQAIRIIWKLHPWASVETYRQRLGWLTLEGKRNVHLATLLFRASRREAPRAICDLFKPVDTAVRNHRFNFRNDRPTNFVIPKWTKPRLQSTLSYRGAKLWNELEDKFHLASDAQACRQLMYKHLLKDDDE